MVQPPLSALFRGSKESFSWVNVERFSYLIPFCIFISHNKLIKHKILLFRPPVSPCLLVQKGPSLIFEQISLLYIENFCKEIPIRRVLNLFLCYHFVDGFLVQEHETYDCPDEETKLILHPSRGVSNIMILIKSGIISPITFIRYADKWAMLFLHKFQ